MYPALRKMARRSSPRTVPSLNVDCGPAELPPSSLLPAPEDVLDSREADDADRCTILKSSKSCIRVAARCLAKMERVLNKS